MVIASSIEDREYAYTLHMATTAASPLLRISTLLNPVVVVLHQGNHEEPPSRSTTSSLSPPNCHSQITTATTTASETTTTPVKHRLSSLWMTKNQHNNVSDRSHHVEQHFVVLHHHYQQQYPNGNATPTGGVWSRRKWGRPRSIPLSKRRGEKYECIMGGCHKYALLPTRFCSAHGGGKRCKFEGGCDKGARGSTDFCVAHGGGKRCRKSGCRKSARWGDTYGSYCFSHGRIKLEESMRDATSCKKGMKPSS